MKMDYEQQIKSIHEVIRNLQKEIAEIEVIAYTENPLVEAFRKHSKAN